MNTTKLITMIEGAVIAAVCVALSFIPLNTANAAFDLSLGLIPLGVYALRRGLLPGLIVGFVWGVLLIVLGKAFFLTIPQILLEYPVAFAFGGFGGIFSGPLQRRLAGGSANGAGNLRGVVPLVVFAGVTAAVARWFFHFWAGVIFWGSYAPAGMSPYLYSFIANGASAAANAVLLAILLSVLAKTARILFIPNKA